MRPSEIVWDTICRLTPELSGHEHHELFCLVIEDIMRGTNNAVKRYAEITSK